MKTCPVCNLPLQKGALNQLFCPDHITDEQAAAFSAEMQAEWDKLEAGPKSKPKKTAGGPFPQR